MLTPPAEKGMPLAEVDTPALIIDLDAFEGNLKRMADALKGKPVRLRAHAKTHKSPRITQLQMELGAVGACCQKVSEAEVLVQGGIPNVLVSNEVIGMRKLERLAALTKTADWLGLCIDSEMGLGQASQAAKNAGVVLDALVEVDVGARRCGVPPGEAALALANKIAHDAHLEFAGIQAYHGSAQHIRDYGERKAAIDQAIAATRSTVDLLRSNGLDCAIVGGAGTARTRWKRRAASTTNFRRALTSSWMPIMRATRWKAAARFKRSSMRCSS